MHKVLAVVERGLKTFCSRLLLLLLLIIGCGGDVGLLGVAASGDEPSAAQSLTTTLSLHLERSVGGS